MVRTDPPRSQDRIRFSLDTRHGDTERRAAMRGHAWTRRPAAIYQDAVSCARAVPAAPVFGPCHGGISPDEAERVTPDSAPAGSVMAGPATARWAARG